MDAARRHRARSRYPPARGGTRLNRTSTGTRAAAWRRPAGHSEDLAEERCRGGGRRIAIGSSSARQRSRSPPCSSSSLARGQLEPSDSRQRHGASRMPREAGDLDAALALVVAQQDRRTVGFLPGSTNISQPAFSRARSSHSSAAGAGGGGGPAAAFSGIGALPRPPPVAAEVAQHHGQPRACVLGASTRRRLKRGLPGSLPAAGRRRRRATDQAAGQPASRFGVGEQVLDACGLEQSFRGFTRGSHLPEQSVRVSERSDSRRRDLGHLLVRGHLPHPGPVRVGRSLSGRNMRRSLRDNLANVLPIPTRRLPGRASGKILRRRSQFEDRRAL